MYPTMYWPTQAPAIDFHQPPPGFRTDEAGAKEGSSNKQSPVYSTTNPTISRPAGGVPWATSHELNMKVQPPPAQIDRDSYEQMCKDSRDRYASMMYEKMYSMWYQGNQASVPNASLGANHTPSPASYGNDFKSAPTSSQRSSSKPASPDRVCSTPDNAKSNTTDCKANDEQKISPAATSQQPPIESQTRGPSPIPTLINGKRYLPRMTASQTTKGESAMQNHKRDDKDAEVAEITKKIEYVGLMDNEVPPLRSVNGSSEFSIVGTQAKDSNLQNPSTSFGFVHPAL